MTNAHIVLPSEGRQIDLGGRTLRVKAPSTTPSRDFMLAELLAPVGDPGPPPHVHDVHEELFYVLEGRFDFLLGDEHHEVGPGCLVVVPPGVRHGFANIGPTPARWLGVASPGGMEAALEDIARVLAAG